MDNEVVVVDDEDNVSLNHVNADEDLNQLNINDKDDLGSIILDDGSTRLIKEALLSDPRPQKWEYLLNVYNKHVGAKGFGTRNHTTRTNKGVTYERYFVCNCQGDHANGKPKLTGKKVKISRTGCKAMIRTQINKDGLWEIIDQIIDHNHSFTPPQWQHNHRSERKITAEEREVIGMMTDALVRPTVQFQVLAATSGGEEFVGHTKRDHINYVNRLKMKAIEGGDATTLVTLLAKCQSEDPDFFYRLKFSDDGRLCNVFWRDSMMKEDYLLYKDVLIFDTTYRTNRYNLICGALVGINNHWSNVMFGFAFISNEKDESFQWVFNAFKEYIGVDVSPVSVFTDQDLAMTNAITEVFPHSKHRLCQWHIQQNAISHYGILKHDRSFQNVFNKCLNGCYSEQEFEDTWRRMISNNGLQDHEWFKRLYDLREKWCTAFNKGYFSVGILSSQRSESTNHSLGFQATKNTSLTEFFHIFESTVNRWRTEEKRNEFNCIRCKPTSVYPIVDLLDHASQVYTLALFRAFEKEFGIAIGTRAIECTTENQVKSYIVYPSGSDDTPHHVTFDSSNFLIECTCRKFEESGMLCYHSIRIYHLHSVTKIPDRYILKRWTKSAKKEVWDRTLPNNLRTSGINDAVNWRREALTKFNHLITKCQRVPEARSILDNAYINAADEIQSCLNSLTVPMGTPNSDPLIGPTILDPNRATTKGRRQRKKSGIQKGKAKQSTKAKEAEVPYTPVPRLL